MQEIFKPFERRGPPSKASDTAWNGWQVVIKVVESATGTAILDSDEYMGLYYGVDELDMDRDEYANKASYSY